MVHPLFILAIATLLPFTLLIGSPQGLAQSGAGVSVQVAGGLATYKSTMLQSNDTGFTVGYGVTVKTGEERGMTMGIQREQSSFAFALNNASLAVATEDVDVTYKWGPVYLGLMFAGSTWYAKAPPDADADQLLDQNTPAEEYLDVVASGYGLRTGMKIPFARRGAAYTDLRYGLAASHVQQSIPEATSAGGISGTSPTLGRAVTMGARMSLDLGVNLPVTKDVLSIITGYRYRTYAMSIGSQGFTELHTSTYVGLSAEWRM